MVNTLRIASVAAVIVAGLVLASVTGLASLKTLDAGRDEELQRILEAPSVVKKFQESQGDKAQDREDAISPLVREAEAFALYLNPPAPPVTLTARQVPSGRPGRSVPPPPPSSAKFDLLGTCYSTASQSDCLAYIGMQDGKTYRWVRIGEEIGHLTIKEIRRDSIVCWDGHSDVPMFVPERQDTSSLLEVGANSLAATDLGVPPSAADRITGSVQPLRPAFSDPVANESETPSVPVTSETERVAMNRLVDELRQSAEQSEDKKATVNKIMEEFRAARERAAAAREMKSAGDEPNASLPISPLQGRPGIRRRLGTSR